MPRAPPVTNATLPSSFIAARFPRSYRSRFPEIIGDRGAHAFCPQRSERVGERPDIARIVGELAENFAHGEKGPRIAPRRSRGGLKLVPAGIVRRNRLAALRFAVAVPAPHRRDERETLDRLAGGEPVSDRRQDELRLPVRAVEAESRDRVADLRIAEALRDLLAVGLEI